MGQGQTTIRSNFNRSIDSLPNAFARMDDGYLDDPHKCCLYKIRTSSKKNQSWRKAMIAQLCQLESGKWPLLLIKKLQEHHEIINDAFYRTKLLEARLILENGQSRVSESIMSNHGDIWAPGENESLIIHQSLLGRGSLKDNLLTVKQLLESTDILEEKLLPSFYREIISGSRIIDEETMLDSTAALTALSESIDGLNLSKLNETNNNELKAKNLEGDRNSTLGNNTDPHFLLRTNTIDLSQGININEVQASLRYYLKVTEIIQAHLQEKDNIFKQLIELFEEYFIKNYQSKVTEIKKSQTYAIEVSRITKRATTDLKQFIEILYSGINMFYDLQNLAAGKLATGYSIFNYDNISNFVTTLVFNDKIYDLLFRLYKVENRLMEKTYKKQAKILENLAPEDFGVPDEYCLDAKTTDYLKSKGLLRVGRLNSVYLEPQLMDTVLQRGRGRSCIDRNDLLTLSMTRVSSYEPNRDEVKKPQECPYAKAIAEIKELESRKSPIQKSKAILKTIEMITLSIDEFYKEIGTKHKKKLAGEDTFMIICYIIANSGIKNVLSHCKMVSEFSTSNAMNSITGYYTSTIEICAKRICNMSLQLNVQSTE